MNETESLERAINEKISIVPYDPTWPQQFEEERAWLLDLFPNRLSSIEHIGSTSVPGLSAKPIIDIMAAVPSMEFADNLLPQLCSHGYATSEEFNATLVNKRWLMKHFEGRRTHHLHLVLFEGDDWVKNRTFRDVLQTNLKVALQYERIKQKLSQELCHEREAYTKVKGEFIQTILAMSETEYRS